MVRVVVAVVLTVRGNRFLVYKRTGGENGIEARTVYFTGSISSFPVFFTFPTARDTG